MVAGIHYLHSKGIIHGQLLPENVILSHPNFHDRSQNHVKIVGFEHADWAAPSSSRRSAGKKLVVDEFLCPEIIKKWEELEPSSPTTITTSSQIRLTKESDLWSFGKILQLLLLGSLQPYPYYHIQHQTLSPKWTTILTELLQPSPSRRATATDLLDLFSSGRPNNPPSSVAGTGVADARAIIDLSRNIPSLAEFVQNHRKSYPLIVSSGIVHFHRGNRYEEEKVFASFQKPIARR
jgi:serine/threonine protein kinase